jgi:hypothetical protein
MMDQELCLEAWDPGLKLHWRKLTFLYADHGGIFVPLNMLLPIIFIEILQLDILHALEKIIIAYETSHGLCIDEQVVATTSKQLMSQKERHRTLGRLV